MHKKVASKQLTNIISCHTKNMIYLAFIKCKKTFKLAANEMQTNLSLSFVLVGVVYTKKR